MIWSLKHYPIFAAKDSIGKWPIYGWFVTYPGLQSILVKRSGTKEEREELVRITGERQALCLKT